MSYPLILNLLDRPIVIVGAGAVGSRKARGLLDGGATRVRAVSPVFHPEFPGAPIERIVGQYDPKYLAGASLVFAATDSAAVNDAIVKDAHAIGALVCRADGDEENAGDFATPAALRKGSLLIAVSSGGSPALSAKVRDLLDQSLDPRWAALAEATRVLRPKIKASLAPHRRVEAFRLLCTPQAVEHLASGGIGALTTWLRSSFPELKD